MSRPARFALAAWLIMIVGISVRVAVSSARSHTIVPIYLTAGERIKAGTCTYDPNPGMDVYRNPPGFAVAFVPFTYLPEKIAGLLWRWLGVTLLLFGLKHLNRDVLTLNAQMVPWFYLLAAPLALSSLDNGQANLHLAGLLALGTAAVARGAYSQAAAWLALAVGIKVYPLALVGLLAIVHWRLIPRVAVALLAVAAFPFLVLPLEYALKEHTAFWEYLQQDDRTHTLLFRVPRDWTVITRTWLDWVPEAKLIRTVSLGVAAFMAVFVRIVSAKPQTALILAAIWMTLFGPATETHTYTLLAPAMALAVVSFTGWFRSLSILASVFLISLVVRDAFPQGWHYAVMGPQPFGAFLLLIATVGQGVMDRWKTLTRGQRWGSGEYFVLKKKLFLNPLGGSLNHISRP